MDNYNKSISLKSNHSTKNSETNDFISNSKDTLQDYSYGSSFWKNARKDNTESIDVAKENPQLFSDPDPIDLHDFSKALQNANSNLNVPKTKTSVAQLLKKIKRADVTDINNKKVFYFLILASQTWHSHSKWRSLSSAFVC